MIELDTLQAIVEFMGADKSRVLVMEDFQDFFVVDEKELEQWEYARLAWIDADLAETVLKGCGGGGDEPDDPESPFIPHPGFCSVWILRQSDRLEA